MLRSGPRRFGLHTELVVAKRNYGFEKRQKEIRRQEKKEEKKQRKERAKELNDTKPPESGSPGAPSVL
jgi:hypothetical protein